MRMNMMNEAVVPTFGITTQSVKQGEVCIRPWQIGQQGWESPQGEF